MGDELYVHCVSNSPPAPLSKIKKKISADRFILFLAFAKRGAERLPDILRCFFEKRIIFRKREQNDNKR